MIRLAEIALALAGLCFVFYPAIRPFSDETTLQGAVAFASSSWVLAHSLAMVGFILLTLGLFGLYLRLQGTAVEGSSLLALVLTGVGIGLTLPYYGAETFGLHAIGQEALGRGDPTLILLAGSVRFGEGVYFFGVGLILLAVGTVLAAVAVWRSEILPRWSGVLLAVAFVLFIPQFFTPQYMRVAHGFLITVGCLWLAWGMARSGESPEGHPTV
ncbi:MAG TPA: hypothetical protein VHS28_01045 [Chloroflexota bacterium]|nr:hypothetical protein [Chloroflexota bacterium]